MFEAMRNRLFPEPFPTSAAEFNHPITGPGSTALSGPPLALDCLAEPTDTQRYNCSMRKQFAVFGNPIAHSKSPEIHEAFAAQFDLPIEYRRELSNEDSFAERIRQFFDNGADGCNVTVPFKELAWKMSEVLTEQAALAGAVNTLYRNENRQLCGHNTDGLGLVNDLIKHHELRLKNCRIAIVGAGGATRGIIQPLAEHEPEQIMLINRTASRAETLARDFIESFPIEVLDQHQSRPNQAVDLLINATSASLSGELPVSDTSLISPETLCYDLAYANEPTSFMQWAMNSGAINCADGTGMLVEQAAAAFYTWTGFTPDTVPVLHKLLAQKN